MLIGSFVLLTILAVEGAAVPPPTPALALEGEAAELFLLEAEVIELENFDTKGITEPRKATLSNGELTLFAVFKDIDDYQPKSKTPEGRVVFGFSDSFKHEIASYELDKVLGLGFVPPTVGRTIGGRNGSLQLWVNGSVREWERKNVQQLTPPDMERWNNQISTIRLFLQLIWDTDFNNVSNLLVDESWKLWKIDASRAFTVDNKLRREDSLDRFSRRVLAALEVLDREALVATLSPWLSDRQINALWQRRTRILELADERVAEFGEAAVLYD